MITDAYKEMYRCFIPAKVGSLDGQVARFHKANGPRELCPEGGFQRWDLAMKAKGNVCTFNSVGNMIESQ